MFMLINKRPYISCLNDVEIWDLEAKKSVIESQGYILGQLRQNEEKYN